MNRNSSSYILGFALVWAIILAGLVAVAIFTDSPYSIVALCVTPVPLIAIGFAVIARGRNALAKIRSARRP